MRLMIRRLLLAGMLVAAGPAWAFAETSCKLTEADVGLTQVPAAFRADFLRKLESDCEIGRLQPVLIQIGVAVLSDIMELEKRPRGRIEEWAIPLRRLHGASMDGYRPLQERMDRVHGVVRPPAPASDEQEVRQGNVARRLIHLAVTGRITKQEYDRLARRLQGN
jgi:hypothetical protein